MSRPRRAAAAALIALAVVLAVGALSFAGPSATAVGGLSPLEVAQVQRANCQVLLVHATSSAQRTRANQCIADQTVIINALTVSPSPSGSPSPTPPGPTATPTPSSTTTLPSPTTSLPSPTPTPSPTGTPLGSWPTPGDTAAGTTGWRHTGVTLTVHTGLWRITTPGAVVDSVDAVDGIEVQANNVTIRRSRVMGANTGPGAGIWIDRGVDGTLIEDVEVTSRPGADPAVEASLVDRAITAQYTTNTVMRRVYAHRMIRGLEPGCSTLVEDSYVDDEVNPGGAHMSAVGTETCAQFVETVRHNHIGLSPNRDDSAALLIYPPQVGSYGTQNVAISWTDNLIAGGTYCLWLSSDPQFVGAVTVMGNRFSTAYYSTCGLYGPAFTDNLLHEGQVAVTWSDNAFVDGRVVDGPA